MRISDWSSDVCSSDLPDFTPQEITAIELSLRVAFWAMAASLPFGVLVAMVLARCTFWGKSLLNGLVHLPLILPPVVTGYLLLLVFGRRGPLGEFLAEQLGVFFAFRWTGRSDERSVGNACVSTCSFRWSPYT